MTSIRKFTFDRSFDEADLNEDGAAAMQDDAALMAGEPPLDEEDFEAEDEVIEEPAPVYSEEDLEIAREEAYVQGHANALAEATAASQRATAEALQTCAGALSALRPSIQSSQDELAELAARLSIEVCRKVLPHTADRYVVDEVQGFVAQLLPSLAAQPRVVVKVHPDMVDSLAPRLGQAAEQSGFEGKIVILADDGLGMADVRTEWADGGAERNTTRLWREIDALIERNLPRFGPENAVEVPNEAPEDDLAAEAVPDMHETSEEADADGPSPTSTEDASPQDLSTLPPST